MKNPKPTMAFEKLHAPKQYPLLFQAATDAKAESHRIAYNTSSPANTYALPQLRERAKRSVMLL